MPLPKPLDGALEDFHRYSGKSEEDTLAPPEKLTWMSLKHLCAGEVTERVSISGGTSSEALDEREEIKMADHNHEFGAIAKRIEELRGVEDLEFSRYVQQRGDEADKQRAQVIESHNVRGTLRSGIALKDIADVAVSMTRDVATKMVDLRRESIKTEPLLGSKKELDALRERIYEFIDHQSSGIPGWMLKELALEGRSAKLPGEMPARIKSEVHLELELLRRRVSLGLIPEEQKEPRTVTVNVMNSNVASVNLGHVIGDINANVVHLETSGHEEVATAIKELSAAVIGAKEVGEEEKRQLLEYLGELSDQARLPPEERRVSVVRVVLTTLKEVLGRASELTAIWGTFGPLIRAFFGM
jgi:hypothetical protein